MSSAYAQLDRVGNVIDGGGGASGFGLNGLIFPIVGAGAGLVYNLTETKLNTTACVIIGAVVEGFLHVAIKAFK